MTLRISLRGGDEAQFAEFKAAITEARGGNEPSNAETLRLMMQELESEDVRTGLIQK
jgi:hypothetical protein